MFPKSNINRDIRLLLFQVILYTYSYRSKSINSCSLFIVMKALALYCSTNLLPYFLLGLNPLGAFSGIRVKQSFIKCIVVLHFL